MVVIDCDSHVMEPADLWREYLEPEFRDRAIRIDKKDGVETLVIGEQPMLAGVLAGLGGAHVERRKLFAPGLGYADGCEPASYEPGARVSMLDDWQVDSGVLFPTIGILPFPLDDLALNSAYCRAYNRWQREFYESAGDRVVPIAVINWHHLEDAVSELKTCLDAGFKGVFVPPEVISGNRPGQPHFDPIWELINEADLPGCLHVIVRFQGGPLSQWQSGPTFTFAMGATSQLIPAMASLVLDGLFERFPKLKVASVEAGCGYAAYLMDRLDGKHRFFGDFYPNPLPMKPSDYVKRNCYFVAEPEEQTIDAMLTLVGEDKILWGSDYPHVDSTLEAPQLIRKSLSGLTSERREAVLGLNAVKLFNL